MSAELGEYELIEPPRPGLLKFIKIKWLPASDNFFSTDSRWGKFSSFGIIASPWVLSTVAIAGGFKANPLLNTRSFGNGALLQFTPFIDGSSSVNHALDRQPKTIQQLQQSNLINKLNQLKEQSTSDDSLLAKSLSSMIAGLPLEVDAPDIIARLSLFIETALLMHRDDHAFFAGFIYPIIHEISLLLLKYTETQKKPYISFEEYQATTFSDVNPCIRLDDPDYEFVALPANSGMHANVIASKFARDLCYKQNNREPSLRREGNEYWEATCASRGFLLFGQLVSNDNANIVRVSAGAIGDYAKGNHCAIDINKLIRAEIKKNQHLKTLIIDLTSASYRQLKLDEDVKKLLAQNNISLIFWESAQKFGLLHTNQAQYGRAFAYCHKKAVASDLIESYKRGAILDMNIPDVQIGAFINKHCQGIMPLIREKHFQKWSYFA